jgi:predicted phosphodiesterase
VACGDKALPPTWWRDAFLLQSEYEAHRSLAAVSRAHGVPQSTLKTAWSDLGLPARPRGGAPQPAVTQPDPLNEPLLRLADLGKVKERPPLGKRERVDGLERLFFIGDLHAPYHHKEGLAIWLRACRDFKPTTVVNMGDFLDCFAVSSYSKDPRRAFGLDTEIEKAKKILDKIEKASPGARRIFIAGNHEDRLQRYLMDKAPELFSFIDVPKLLELKERGWEHVPYKKSIRIGKLHLTHDVGSAGRYNAFRALEAFQAPVVTGHTHRMSYVVEGDASGGTQVSTQFGWLGDVEQVDYMHRVQAMKNWTLGFGYGYLNPHSGYVYLVPVPIVKGTCVVEGRLYGAARQKARAA